MDYKTYYCTVEHVQSTGRDHKTCRPKEILKVPPLSGEQVPIRALRADSAAGKLASMWVGEQVRKQKIQVWETWDVTVEVRVETDDRDLGVYAARYYGGVQQGRRPHKVG